MEGSIVYTDTQRWSFHRFTFYRF